MQPGALSAPCRKDIDEMALPLESRYSRAINDRIKSVSAGGGWLRRVGGFTGPNGSGERTAETRRHAASNNKTNI